MAIEEGIIRIVTSPELRKYTSFCFNNSYSRLNILIEDPTRTIRPRIKYRLLKVLLARSIPLAQSMPEIYLHRSEFVPQVSDCSVEV